MTRSSEVKAEENTAIILKWGSIKGWDLSAEDPCCFDLVKQWDELGSSMSAAAQRDTPEQKQIICDLIDAVKGKIFLDWDGKYVTKDEAKDYVRNYGIKDSPHA